MLTTFKVKYFYADNSIIIPQVNNRVNKGTPYRNPIPFDQVMGF